MKKIFSLLIIIFLFINSVAQNWTDVGGGFTVTLGVHCMFSDSFSNKLYVGGGISKAGSVPLRSIASWDGLNWSAVGSGCISATDPIWSITRFRNRIIASGRLFRVNGNFIGAWNFSTWDSLASGTDSYADAMISFNDTLYVGGTFTSADTCKADLFAKWDGSRWYGYDLPFRAGGRAIGTICSYKNKIYIGGNFYDSVNTQIHALATIENGQALMVGPASTALSGWVEKLIVYKDELYIAGFFNSAFGSNIIKWDGTSMSAVGSGLGVDWQIMDMTVFNDELYIVGSFEYADGVYAQYIARWDGLSWHAVSNDVFDIPVNCVAVFQNELYIAGGFTDISSQPFHYIAKYTGPLAVDKISESGYYSIQPNPCIDKLTISFNNNLPIDYYVYDYIGAGVLKGHSSAQSLELNVSNLKPGVYFLKVNSEKGNFMDKFIKL